MTRRAGATAAASLVLALALTVASLFVAAGPADALPQSLPLRVSFTDLRAGDVRSTSWPVQIPHKARIESASLAQQGPGDLRWTVQLCPSSGGACLDGLAPGMTLAAGSYDLRVGLTVLDLDPGQTQTLEGRYTLVAAGSPPLAFTDGGPGGGLALTGSGAALPLGLAAVAAGSVGVLFVVIARRRRTESDEPGGEPC